MKIFDNVEEKGMNLVYTVNKLKLEEIGEEKSKMLLAVPVINNLIAKYPQKREELLEIKYLLGKYADDNIDNAEAQLILFGIDKILWELNKVLRDE